MHHSLLYLSFFLSFHVTLLSFMHLSLLSIRPCTCRFCVLSSPYHTLYSVTPTTCIPVCRPNFIFVHIGIGLRYYTSVFFTV
ncbi:hypothetical protein GYMLUDRAFT_454924 [Collybiopsis luxurians FD-317 M1]|uniref:Uncharacterized protein n=1 Tax=Collybiopsis luxurians FD-317 M1 TaxID=944289 RepID=A0A0D0C6M5_9AGAR|nr:hypothetical protein GYMLUDRAFT_454924 [Collybiopsis luxurians FD-317 M1]